MDKMILEDFKINEDFFLIFCLFVRGCNRKYIFDNLRNCIGCIKV